MGDTVLVPHVSSKIISPLDPLRSDPHTPFNRSIHAAVVMLCAVVPVKRLLRLEGSSPRTIRGFTGKSASGAGMRATMGVVQHMLV